MSATLSSIIFVFDKEIESFIKNDLSPNLKNPILSIEPKKLTFEITYKQIKDLEKEKIALSAKPFTIEPLEATPLEKRIFCTHTPFDSYTHFQVLKAFESTFSSPPKLAKRRKKRILFKNVITTDAAAGKTNSWIDASLTPRVVTIERAMWATRGDDSITTLVLEWKLQDRDQNLIWIDTIKGEGRNADIREEERNL